MKKIDAIFLLAIFSLFINFGANAQIPELLYYKFDAPGPTVINHATNPVGTNPATIVGSGLTIGSTGLSGTALVGTGTSGGSDYVNTGWATSLSGSFTIAFWTSNIAPSSTLWYIWGDNSANSFRCFTNGVAGANNWIVRGGGLTDLLLTGGAVAAPKMNHVVYDATSSQLKGYVDGVLVSTVSVSGSINISGSGFKVGAYGSNSNLSGLMDEFRIYNRALTQAEITATWNQSLGAPTDAALLGFENVDDSLCGGNLTVLAWLKNLGPNQLTGAKINWSVDNIPQQECDWSGNIPVNDSAVVAIGTYNFQVGNLFDIEAYISESNSGPDTINNSNDTLRSNGVYAKLSPSFTPSSQTYYSCAGDSVLIDGTLAGIPPWDIFVEHGMNNFSITNITSSSFGFYVTPNVNTIYRIVTVLDNSDCPNYDTLDISVEVVPKPTAHITLMAPPVGCEGDIIPMMVTTNPNYTCQWYRDGVIIPGATNTVYNAMLSGGYRVQVNDTVGCSTMSPKVDITIHPAPYVFIGNDTAVTPGISLTLDAGPGFNSYVWSTGLTTQSIIIDSTGVGIGTKTVWVRVTDNNNCPGSDTIHVTFDPNPGLDNAGLSDEVRIFPNPNKGSFVVVLSQRITDDRKNLDILDAKGRVLKTVELINGETVQTIDITDMPSGLYFVRIKGVSGLFKVVMMR